MARTFIPGSPILDVMPSLLALAPLVNLFI
jgi:hypothetical protein